MSNAIQSCEPELLDSSMLGRLKSVSQVLLHGKRRKERRFEPPDNRIYFVTKSRENERLYNLK